VGGWAHQNRRATDLCPLLCGFDVPIKGFKAVDCHSANPGSGDDVSLVAAGAAADLIAPEIQKKNATLKRGTSTLK